MNENIVVVLSTIIFLIFLLTLFFIYISVQSLKQRRSEQRVKQYIKDNGAYWYNFIIEGKDVNKIVNFHTNDEKKAIDLIMARYVNSVSGQMIITRISQFIEQYLIEYYRDMLRSKHWSIRINGLHKIHDFHLLCLKEDVSRMLNTPKKYSKEEYILIYMILTKFKDENLVVLLQNPKYYLGEFEYKKILSQLEQKELVEFVNNFDDLQFVMQLVVIDMIGLKRCMKGIDLLENLLKSSENEYRIRALKSIGLFGHVKNIENYSRFVDSELWEERLMMAKLLGNLPLSQSLPYLESLIKDTSWWVRRQAALSLSYQKVGLEELQRISLSDEDPFASDIAKEILERV